MNFKHLLALVVTSSLGAAAMAQTIYAYDIRQARFLTFSAATPLTQTVLGTSIPNTIRSLDFDPTGTNLYALNGATVPALAKVDQSNGSFLNSTNITGLVTGDALSGLAISSGGKAYMSGTQTGASRLYSLDLSTAVATVIGTITSNLVIDIAIDSKDNLYAMDITTDSLWGVDKTTGAGTLIGATGFATNFSQGMDFDPATDVLYATLYTGGGTGHFASINTSTGVATSIANIASLNGEYEMAVKPAPVPEPATMFVLAGGVAALVRKRKTR